MTRPPGGWRPLAVRLYGLCLLVYPARVRARFGRDQLDAFSDGYAAARGRGRGSALVFAVRSLMETLLLAVRERAGRRVDGREGGLSRLLTALGRDVAYALRALRLSPGFTVAAILTLALGIGATAAIFSVLNAVWLRPLPYPESERLVALWDSQPQRGWLRYGVSAHDFVDWQERNRVFGSMAVYVTRAGNLTGGDEPERVQYTMVSSPFLSALQTPPAVGRDLSVEEDHPGADGVALISDGLAMRRFGGPIAALGQEIVLDDRPLTVVGVMPAGFEFPAGTHVWKPWDIRPVDGGPRASYWVRAIARLAPEVTLQQARDDMDRIMAALAQEYPESNGTMEGFVEPLLDSSIGSAPRQLLIVQAIVVMVLLIAAANVSNLLLARASVRGGEMALRVALGASTGRLVRQLMTESMVLAMLGGAIGLAVAQLLLHPIVQLGESAIPRSQEVSLDATVVLFSIAVSTVVGVVFGVAPAWRAARSNVADALRQGGRSAVGAGGERMRRVFAVGQVAIAFIVLTGAALLVRSFANVVAVDPGFDASDLLTLRVEPPMFSPSGQIGMDEFMARLQAERVEVGEFYRQLLQRVDALPGVHSAAIVNRRPFGASNMWSTRFNVEGKPLALGELPPASARVVVPGYLRTLGIPLLSGRVLRADDDLGAERVAVLSASAAEAGFGDEDPLGRRITMEDPEDSSAAWYAVVGVVDDVPLTDLEQPADPVIYTTLAQARFGHFGDWGMDLVVRTAAEPASVATEIRGVARALNPNLPLFQIQTMHAAAAARLAPRRFSLTLLSLFGGLALLLTGIGVYGVMAYSVSQRVHEIGVRMALGARSDTIIRMVLGDGSRLAALGLTFGILGSLATAGVMQSMLFGVAARDLRTLAEVTVVLAAVVTVACCFPAWRSARLEPSRALREG